MDADTTSAEGPGAAPVTADFVTERMMATLPDARVTVAVRRMAPVAAIRAAGHRARTHHV
ncbi:MAG TPA: hypothetical protein VF060_20505 [Trebonia sp.]